MRSANTDFKETYDGFGLRYSKDKKIDEYPKTMQQAVDIMATIKPKKKASGNKNRNSNQNTNQNEGSDGNNRVQTSFAQRGNQSERRCFRCGDTRHISPDCPNRDQVPSGQWYRETGIEHYRNISHNNVGSSNNANESNENDDVTVQSETSVRSNQSTNQRVSWSGANICMQQNAEDVMMPSYKDLLLLDTGSTHNMSCKKFYVYDVHVITRGSCVVVRVWCWV